MKFIEPNAFTDPDATARKLLEIANATEPAQDGRIYIELVNAALPKGRRHGRAVPRRYPEGGRVWLTRHESGTYVMFTRPAPNCLPEAPRIKRLDFRRIEHAIATGELQTKLPQRFRPNCRRKFARIRSREPVLEFGVVLKMEKCRHWDEGSV
jgi:hypothetical protein